MKLKFKIQPFQTEAVESVVDCFAGQPSISGITYRIDPGRINAKFPKKETAPAYLGMEDHEEAGFKNADIQIPKTQIPRKHQIRAEATEPPPIGETHILRGM